MERELDDDGRTVTPPTGVDAEAGDDAGASQGRAARDGEWRWKAQLRRTSGGALLLKAGVLLLGSAFIALGLVLAVLPGPLTIPPVLLGLWILASEFGWADRLFQRAEVSAREAWAKARQRPVTSAVTTALGLVALGVGMWAVGRYDLVGRARDAVGL